MARVVRHFGSGRPYQTLIGFVKPMENHQGATQEALTVEAVTRGTPAFMSPSLLQHTLRADSESHTN